MHIFPTWLQLALQQCRIIVLAPAIYKFSRCAIEKKPGSHIGSSATKQPYIVVVHELNNRLEAMRLYAALLCRTLSRNSDSRHYAHKIEEAAQSCDRLLLKMRRLLANSDASDDLGTVARKRTT